jgi:uncharacterized membrane protein
MVATTQDEGIPFDRFVIAEVDFDAPWNWLAAGWRDIVATPGLSLGYGAVFAVISILLAYGLTAVGWESLVLALIGGFMILGPLFAVGLYEISRRRMEGEPIDISAVIATGASAPRRLAFMGFVLLFMFSIWLRIAFLLFAAFYGSEALPSVERFLPELLFTPHGLGLLIVGTAVGGGLALLVYMISVVSVPMLISYPVDVFTAIAVSFQSVVKNPKPMLLWAVLIAAIMACGIATAFIGLIVAFPLVGHATWHAFRDIVHAPVDAS